MRGYWHIARRGDRVSRGGDDEGSGSLNSGALTGPGLICLPRLLRRFEREIKLIRLLNNLRGRPIRGGSYGI